MSLFSKENEEFVGNILTCFAVLSLFVVGMWTGMKISEDDLGFTTFAGYSDGNYVVKGFLQESFEAGFNYFKCLTWFNGKQYFDFNCMKAVDAQKKKEYFNTAID